MAPIQDEDEEERRKGVVSDVLGLESSTGTNEENTAPSVDLE
jgi:hypothetical protein